MTALLRLLRLFVDDPRFAAAQLGACALAAAAPTLGLPRRLAGPLLLLLLAGVFAATLLADAAAARRARR